MASAKSDEAGAHQRAPLGRLVQQIAAIIAQGEDSGSQSQHTEVRSKLREVLIRLLDAGSASPASGRRELRAGLRLLNLAMEKVPRWVAGESNALLIETLVRLVPLMSRDLPDEVWGELVLAGSQILAWVAATDQQEFAALLRSFFDLLEDTCAVAIALSTDPTNAATVECRMGSLAAADSAQPTLSIELDSAVACERLLRVLLRVLADTLAAHPLATTACLRPAVLTTSCTLLVSNSIPLQAAAMHLLAAAVHAGQRLPLRVLHLPRVLPLVLSAAEAQHAGGDPLLKENWFGRFTCLLYALVDSLPIGDAAGAAGRRQLAHLAAQAARAAPIGGPAQDRLCQLLAEALTLQPELLRHVTWEVHVLGSCSRRARLLLLDACVAFLRRFPAEQAKQALEGAACPPTAAAPAVAVLSESEGQAGRVTKRRRTTPVQGQRAEHPEGTASAVGAAQGENRAQAVADALVQASKQLYAPLAGTAAARAAAGEALADILVALAPLSAQAATALLNDALKAWPGLTECLAAEQLPDEDDLPVLLQLSSAALLAHMQHPVDRVLAALLGQLGSWLQAACDAGGAAAAAALVPAVLALHAAVVQVESAIVVALTQAAMGAAPPSLAKVAAATLLPVATCIVSTRDSSHQGRGSQHGSRKQRHTGPSLAGNPFVPLLHEAVVSQDQDVVVALVAGLNMVLRHRNEPLQLAVAALAAVHLGRLEPQQPLPTGQASLSLACSEWMRAALEALCQLPPASLRHDAHAGLVEAVCGFLRHASPAQLEHGRALAEWLIPQVVSPCAGAREALLRNGRLLAETQFLLTLLHEGPHPIHTRDRLAAAERKEQTLMQQVKEQMQCPEAGPAGATAVLQLVSHAGAAMRSHIARLMAIAILVSGLTNAEPEVAAVAARGLLGTATLQNCSLKDLLLRDPQLLNHIGKQVASRPDMLTQLAELLGMRRRQLAAALLPAAVPALFSPPDLDALQAMAAHAHLQPMKMLYEYGHHAVARALLTSSPSMAEFMPAVEAICKQDFTVFAHGILPKAASEIVTQTGAAKEWGCGTALPEAAVHHTAEVLAVLASTAGEIEHEPGMCAATATSKFLANGDHVTRMLKEIGDALDKKLPAAQEPHADSANVAAAVAVLRCVLVLIRLTGPYVGRFLPQLMVLLGAAVRPANPAAVRLQGLEGWLMLVRALAAEAPVQLGGVVNQVVVALLDSMQDTGPVCAAAARVVEELLTVCRRNYKEKLRSMPPLPQWPPELQHVNTLLQEERGKLTTVEQVELLLEGLGHEALSVRATALQELRSLLEGRREWLLDLHQADAGAAAGAAAAAVAASGEAGLLHRLVAALLKCCEPEAANGAGTAAQQACALCLGMIGAVDPSRIQVDPAPPVRMCTSDGELVLTLLTKHLVRLLKTAPNLQTLDATTFAIQEVMRTYPNPPGLQPPEQQQPPPPPTGWKEGPHALFAALPLEVQAIVTPFFDSKYSIRSSARRPQGVVFGQMHSFRRWLALWLTQLVDHYCTGDRFALFKATVPLLRCDIPTAMFLTPYLVHHVVTCSQDGAAAVLAEIDQVLRADSSSRDGVLCLQAVFALLDTLQRWCEDARDAAAKAARKGGSAATASSDATPAASTTSAVQSRKSWDSVSAMLKAVPKETLARAAARCGAHARALLYFETHVRAVRNGGANPAAHRSAQYSEDEVTFLQEVYSRLEEPDGLDGLVKMRIGGARPEDQRLAAEKAGSWGEALTLYERDLYHGSEAGGNQALAAAAAVLGVDASGAGGDGGVAGLPATQRGYLNCLLQMGHWQGLLTQVRGLAAGLGGGAGPAALPAAQLASMGTAAAWRLGHWHELDACLAAAEQGFNSLDPEARWEVRIGRLLRAASHGDAEALQGELTRARADVMSPFSAAAMESYTRAYAHLVKLHMLQEVADSAALMDKGIVGPKSRHRMLRWPQRLALTQPTLATQAPILALRRQLAALAPAPAEAGHCWLQHAQLCRATGHYDAAVPAVLEAAAAKVPGATLERVELLYARGDSVRGDQHRAITELASLELQLAGGGTDSGAFGSEAERSKHHARVLLTLAQWMADAGQGAREEVTGLYDRALSLQAEWETGLFRYATYLDQLMQDARARQERPGEGGAAGDAASTGRRKVDRLGGHARIKLGEDRPHLLFLPEVIRNYGRSVQAGTAHIYRSLPRLLTLWFDFGATPAAAATAGDGTAAATLRVAQAVQDLMRGFSKSIPLQCWLTALPQLISRMCHPNQDVAAITKAVIVRLTEAYPQQALWALAAVSKSTVQKRRGTASSIISTAKRTSNTEVRRIFNEMATFSEQLIRLCMQQKVTKKTMSASREFNHLVRCMPLAVMVPTMAALTVCLPPGAAAPGHEWSPFAESVTVASMHDEIEVMSSLQKPKKVTFIGSDGRDYIFLAKPKDDLRKDNRMMEFGGVLNRCFQEEAASRRRNLYLRRFSVVPVTEDCGIVEWVLATRPMRHCITEAYLRDGILLDTGPANHAVKARYEAACAGADPNTVPLPRLVTWLNTTLAGFPPIFHRWFLGRFPEPAAWFNARLAYTRTYAAWCMVGHVVGLGDRHGENILMDESSGDTVQIDFSMLFDKGITLNFPEMVPFRLTHNCIDGFGVAGVEGVFRRSCEVTLGVLRAHSDTVLSVMDTFVHDPLVEWVAREGKGKGEQREGTGAGDQKERGENPSARDAMATIDGRLKGTLLGVSSKPCMALSVEGHTHRLIQEASAKENLAKMYIWWQAWY